VCWVRVEAAFFEVPFRVVQDAAEFELARLRERRVAAEEAKSSLQEVLEAAAAARVAREQKIVAKAQAAHTKRIQQVPCAASCAFLRWFPSHRVGVVVDGCCV
jgi:phage terminase Nu1 subunit (DNA packaging protein)